MEFTVEPPAGIVYLVEKDMRGNGDWFIDTTWNSSLTPAEALFIMRTARSVLAKVIKWRVAEYQVWADGSMTCLRTFTRLPR